MATHENRPSLLTSTDPSLPEWLRGRTFEELRAIEAPGIDGAPPRILVPDAVRYRQAKTGAVVTKPVLLSPPCAEVRALARIDAMKHVELLRQREKRPVQIRTVDEAREAVGADVFENIDTAAIVSRCVFEPAPPHGRAYLLDVLRGTFSEASIHEVYGRLDWLARLFDPRVPELDDKTFWVMIKEIARCGNLGPLAVIDAYAQERCVLRMASLLSSSPTLPASSPSSGTSTPES